MKEFLKKMLYALKSNLLLKIMAVLFAVVIWSYVMADDKTVREKTVRDIPVSYIGAEELNNRGLTIDETATEYVTEVTISLDVAQEFYKRVSQDTLTATVNLAQITDVGEQDLPIRIDSTVSVTSMNKTIPETVTLTVDELVERNIPVQCILEGDSAEGLYIEKPKLSKNYITVKGARSKIEQVSQAVCYVPVEGLDSSIRASYVVTLLDESGMQVVDRSLKGNVPSVIVELDVLPKKTVPIDSDTARKSVTNVKQGYEVTNLAITPQTVTIAAEQDVLDRIDKLQLQPINANDADRGVLLDAQLQVPEGVTLVGGKEHVEVYVQIFEIQSSRLFQNIPLELKNLEDGLRADVSVKRADVRISGGASVVETVKTDDIDIYVDLANLRPGTYVRQINVESIQGVTNSVIEPATITVVISIEGER